MTRPPGTVRAVAILLVVAMATVACAGGDGSATVDGMEEPTVGVASGVAREFPPPPPIPTGPLSATNVDAIAGLVGALAAGDLVAVADRFEIDPDPRTLWIVADVLRFTQGTAVGSALVETAETLAGIQIDRARPWGDLTDHLIAWDVPAPPDYREDKREVFSAIDERWDFVFADPDADIDFRLIHWGGVRIDDRSLGDPLGCPLGCIPALDDPALTPVADGGWYPDDEIVFGIEIGGEAVAFPRNVMEVHEMVNATIGGRRVAIPYCTLCGSAQVFFTDEVDGTDRPLVMRTSGLLSRSNKVMFDLDTRSVFDTFTGRAVAGPLRALGVRLGQASVVTTTWREWRVGHPATLIVAEDGGVGYDYPLDPLRARDADGPIFPIGQVDDRLPVHEQVLGVVPDDGPPLAFPADAARQTLRAGGRVELRGVSLELDAGGLRARSGDRTVPSHQAFWFAWSQFHPDTSLWLPAGAS